MKKILIAILILFVLFISGCTDIEQDMNAQIMSDIPIIGQFWRHTNTENTKVTTTNKTGAAPGLTNKLPDIPKNTVNCPAHQYWNQMYYTCMCEANYYMQNGACIPKSSRECVADRDCSPNGQLSVCYGQYSKKVYYCDLNSYTCVGGKGNGMLVDCRSEYGSTYKCSNGNCIN